MSIFNQLVPRLTRSLARENGDTTEATTAPEFTLKPAYEVKETAEAWGLTVFLPGVTREGLELSAEEGRVTVRGHRAWRKPEAWTQLYRESADVPYELVLEHDHTVNAEKIAAELRDGVLLISLPKAEAVKPRKIAIS